MSCVASPIQRVHHSAYRCRDSGATRTGRATETLHTRLDKGRAQGVDTRGIVDHGMCAFDNPDHWVLANAHYRKIWRLHEDVTEQRQAQERALASNRRGESLALFCLDLDRFKPVNDTYGHAAGDELLRQVAQRLRECVRETDVVARLGGDEFSVVQRGAVQPEGSTWLAHRLIDVLTRLFDVDGHVVHIGTSVGVAMAPSDGEDSETLLRHADLALYRAKSEGRGQLSYFEPDMNERVDARRGLEN